jgi:hypothetical protein
MAYRIEGLSPAPFAPLFGMDEAALTARGAMRVIADAPRGYPCRVSLRDAEEGERLILLNHVSHDVAGPFRTAYAIYVREGAAPPAPYVDELPDYLDRRTLSLRGFGADGLLKGAVLANPGQAEAKIRALFEAEEVATIHAHNAAHGCFLARIGRN